MDADETILFPLMGEKATLLREKTNSLTFAVNPKATKSDIKNAVESLFNVEVEKVNTMKTLKGRKKAHVKLTEKYFAEEVASHMGVI
ncbi:MAG: 50S ribosomal protein L23 [Candidatus Altiarchaeales archaeon]|nr:50S ribosomal protein L23 [Candidatus Altiarchaeales archaeon]